MLLKIQIYIEIHNVGTAIYKTGYMVHMESYLLENVSFLINQSQGSIWIDRGKIHCISDLVWATLNIISPQQRTSG